MAKYPYIGLPSQFGTTPKPAVYVRLGYQKTHKVTQASILALIDSGADVCFCDMNIGQWLGINFSAITPTSFYAANNESFEAYGKNITIYVCNKQYQCIFFFSKKLPLNTPIILGQMGFFDHFTITFNRKASEMIIV